MIASWRLARFKAIKDHMEQISFGSLTIFAGANSSGKSTVIQSILMLMQTIANRENSALLLNGALASLGEVDDLWFNGDLPGEHDEQKYFQLEATLDINAERELYLWLEFVPLNKTNVRLVRAEYALGNEDDGYELNFTLEWDGERGVHRVTGISERLNERLIDELHGQGLRDIKPLLGVPIDMFDFYPRRLLVEAQTVSQEINWSTVISDPLGVQLTDEDLRLTIAVERLQLIERAMRELNLPEMALRNERRQARLEDYREWFGNLSARQAQQLQAYLRENLDDLMRPVETWYPNAFFDQIEAVLFDLFTRRINYLSAYRISPKTLFQLGNEPDWSEVGINGHNVAVALKEHGDRQIAYWDPTERVVREGPVLTALYKWLQFFSLLDRIEAEDRGKLGTLLRVYSPGVSKELDLTSVGFGVSQILPIIVQGLMTPPNNVFIVEQPEVHLHPHVQSQLAYFFFALTRVHVQCIVETHSEYIVNQLRLLMAKGQKHLHEEIKIYFAQRYPEAGTQFEEVRLNRGGKIQNWPPGFMDESGKLAKEMLIAATERL